MVTGGHYDENELSSRSDVCASWTESNSSAGWSGRALQVAVALSSDPTVLVGGRDSSGSLDDVWRSRDSGTTWVSGQQTLECSDGGMLL